MSELRKANTDLAYYLTFTTAGWIDVFYSQHLGLTIFQKYTWSKVFEIALTI